MIEFQNVSKSYGPKKIFQNAELTIAKGEHLALVGANGTGKSTLVRMIVGEGQGDDAEDVGADDAVAEGLLLRSRREVLDDQRQDHRVVAGEQALEHDEYGDDQQVSRDKGL